MTLKEKLYEYSGDPLDCNPVDQQDAQNLVKIADDYAVAFAKWYYCKKLLLTYSATKKTSELLEIYKKEKGL
jgi:hypothetical protein